MGWMAKVRAGFDRASETLEDIEQSGLPGNASKLAKSISQVIGRYAPEEEKKKPAERDQ